MPATLTKLPTLVAPTGLPSTTYTLIPTATLSPNSTNTPSPSPAVTAILLTATVTPVETLEPEIAKATLVPLLQDPLNCDVPCFWGIIPGKTRLDEAKVLLGRLGFTPNEGTTPSGMKAYGILYNKFNPGDRSDVAFYIYNGLIENMVINPDISQQKSGSPRTWIGYSPETLIKKYGKPSRVEFAIDRSQKMTIGMTMYFDNYDLISDYSGLYMESGYPYSPRFCPLTYPFDHVRLWIGSGSPDAPSFPTVPLEKATSLTIDQFTQLMLGDPQHACFTLKGDAFQ